MTLLAGFLNAISLGVIGFAVRRPATDSFQLVGLSAGLWGGAGLLIHAVAHYIPGQLRREPSQ